MFWTFDFYTMIFVVVSIGAIDVLFLFVLYDF
jgi:NADH:ubiquinone oxidoreductase subunit 6 (subunit J)